MVLMIRSILIFSLVVTCIESSEARSEISERDSDEYFEFLARTNHYAPLEHAGSHGTIGMGLGLSLASYPAPQSSDILREHWRAADQPVAVNDRDAGRIVIPRIQMHKGLPLSLDVGLGLGQEPGTKASLVSGYIQWTLFEAFAAPAIAVRGGYNRLMGLATTDASSLVGEVVASYGFMRILTLYGSMGIGRHSMVVRTGPGFGTTMALDGEQDGVTGRTIVRRGRGLGIQVQILPPFFTATAEVRDMGGGAPSYLAKVSLGI